MNHTVDLLKATIGLAGIVAWWAWLVIGTICSNNREQKEAEKRCRENYSFDWRKVYDQEKRGEEEE